MRNKNKLTVAMGLVVGGLSCNVWAGTPVQCVSTGPNTCVYTYSGGIDLTPGAGQNYGNTATITFNDWGYTQLTQTQMGVGVNDFQVGSGFNPLQIGQIQNVVTKAADWLTSDPAMTVTRDFIPPGTATPAQTFYDASMDTTVNFYSWAYRTVGGSTFTDMKIDTAGNYLVNQADMNFKFYDTFLYHDGNGATNGLNPDFGFDTSINFKPYAISDARGWCGSVLTSDPNAVEKMAGQVTFDFAFDAYQVDAAQSASGGGTQIVPSFVMRSYGDYVVESSIFGGVGTGATELTDDFTFRGSAVGNNTNPTSVVLGQGGTLDAAYQNKVSFLGGGIVPKGVWVTAGSYVSPGVKKLKTGTAVGGDLRLDGTWDVKLVDTAVQTCDPGAPGAAPEAGAVCYQNSFAGYPFLMRADGARTVTYINPDGFSIYSAVPVPGAVWLFGSGLLGLGAVARRSRHRRSGI